MEETIGQRLRRLRLERNLPQRAIAGPGVSYAYISRIEAGQRQPSVKALRLLAEKLDVSPEYLETGRGYTPATEREWRLGNAELELRLDRDVEGAEATLRELIEEQGRDSVATRARAALGILAARRGDNEEATRQLEAVVASGLRPQERAEVFETLAAVYVATEQASQALSLLEGCLRDVEPENVTLQVRLRSLLGTTHASIGAFGRARTTLLEATELAGDYAAPSARVNLYWSLARVAWMSGDSVGGMTYVNRAIALLETTEDTLQLARAHLAAAQMLSMEGQVEEAGPHLDQAEGLLVQAGDHDDLGLLRAEQAKWLARNGRGEEAVQRATEAVGLLEGDVRHASTALHALGVAHGATGSFDAADDAFRRALAAMGERGNWREAAQVARDWANVLRRAGRDADAFEVLDRATNMTIVRLRESAAAART